MIYLCSADDTAGRQCILAPPASLFLSLMLPRKGQPFPPERRNCSHTLRGVLQFRLPSAPQRYNTLDFPGKVGKSCANRDAARPYWKPRAKGATPLWTPYIFSSPVHSAYIKRQSYFNLISLIYFTFSENKKSHRLHLSWKNEICEIFIPLCQDVHCCSHR